MGGGAKAFFVDPANGNDGNTGLKPNKGHALKTVAAAYALCTDKQGDTVYLLNDGNTSGSARESAGLVWAKDNTHLIGWCAPAINQRSRITPPTTSTVDVDAFTPMLTVSANGCIFKNFALVQGQSEDGKASVGIHVTGLRNYFENVSVLTGLHANQGDEAGTSWVRVDGEENVFEGCYIGQDTIARSAANANVQFGSGSAEEATRNVFRNCIFPAYADNAGVLFINAANATDTQRWNLFEGCTFVNTGTSTMTEGVQYDGNGVLLLKDCGFYGCTDVVAADNTSTQLVGPAGSPNVDVGMFKGVDIA
jgi:hypothetical protein